MYELDTSIIQSVKEVESGYRLTLTDGSVWFVPNDPANSHYQLIQRWINEGNTPEPKYTVDELKAIKFNEVTQKRRQLENEGIVVTGNAQTYYLDTSLTGRANLAQTIQMFDLGILDKTTDTVNWKFKDGNFYTMTYDNLVELAGYATQYIEALFGAEQTHRTNINNLSTIEDLEAYDINANWPSNSFVSTTLP